MKKLLISICVMIFLISSISALAVNFTSPTPSNNSVVNSRNVIINATITSANPLDTILFNWNGTNYSVYDPSLVLYYNFDNRSALGENGTYVADVTGKNNGTAIGGSANVTATSNGKYFGGYKFGGMGYINIVDSVSLNLSSQLTISGWINWTDDNTKTFSRIIRKGTNYEIYIANSTKTLRFIYKNATAQIDTIGSVGEINDSKWHYFTVTYNSNSNALFYLDGVLRQTVAAKGPINQTGSTLTISNSFDSFQLNGTLDELMIFNRELSSNEIKRLYSSQLTKFNNTYLTYTTFNETLYNDKIPYNFYVNDTTGNSIYSNINYISWVLTVKSIFSQAINNINSYLYGANIQHGLTSEENISNSLSCSATTPSNYLLEQTVFQQSKMNNIRLVMGIYNNVNSSFSTVSNSLSLTNKIKYAYDNNLSYTLIVLGMPAWLANTTNAWCTTGLSDCSPTNYDSWGKAVVSYMNNITNNGQYINSNTVLEVLNEPQGTGWLGNLSNDNVTKAEEYVKLFNSTYSNVKANNSNIKIIGLGGTDIAYSFRNIPYYFFNNISSADGYSLHYYYNTLSGTQSADNISAKIQTYKDYCVAQGKTYCNNIYLNEFNTYNLSGIARTDLQIISTASIYYQLIDSNITQSSLYLWTSEYKNESCDAGYNYTMYSQVNNAYYPPYNVTYQFARQHSAGDTVVNSSSDYSPIKVVSSKNGNKYSVTIINTDTDVVNITLNTTGYTGYLMDVQSGVLYDLSSGSVNFGDLNSYGIKYLSTPSFSFTQGIGLIKKNSFNETIAVGNEVWITKATSEQVKLASNLTTQSMKIILTGLDCNSMTQFKYTPSGADPQILTGTDARAKCNEITSTGSTLTVNPSTESNEFDFEYGCNSTTRIGFTLILLMSALAIVSVVIVLGYNGIYGDGVTVGQLVIGFVVVITGLVLWQVFGQNLGSVCGGL